MVSLRFQISDRIMWYFESEECHWNIHNSKKINWNCFEKCWNDRDKHSIKKVTKHYLDFYSGSYAQYDKVLDWNDNKI